MIACTSQRILFSFELDLVMFASLTHAFGLANTEIAESRFSSDFFQLIGLLKNNKRVHCAREPADLDLRLEKDI